MSKTESLSTILFLTYFLLYIILTGFVVSKTFMYALKDDKELYKNKTIPIIIMTVILAFVDYYFYLKTGMYMFLAQIIPILQIQRYSDVKDKTVYILINRLLVMVAVTDVILFGAGISYLMILSIILECIILYVFYIKGNFGRGDLFVMMAVAIITQIMPKKYNTSLLGVLFFLIFILISNIFVFFKGLIISKKENTKFKEIKVAFYPYMEVGFLGTVICSTYYYYYFT